MEDPDKLKLDSRMVFSETALVGGFEKSFKQMIKIYLVQPFHTANVSKLSANLCECSCIQDIDYTLETVFYPQKIQCFIKLLNHII